MGPRGAALSMLAVAGVAVGHILGYAIAHPDAAARQAALGGHAYLPAAASVVVPLGVAAALVWAVRTSRHLGVAATIPFRTLAVAQVAVFAVQEVGERLVAGQGPAAVLAERGVWFGLLAQLLVAAAVTRALHAVRRVVRAVLRGGRVHRAPRPALPIVLVPARAPRRAPASVAVGLRAPPVVGAAR